LLSKGCYQLSPRMYISLDTEEFENLVIQAKGSKEKGARYEQYLKKAILLYKEGFAVGWYDTWTDDFRRHFQGLYEDCLGMIASLCVANNKLKDAIVWYRKLLSVDFYNEEYHRKLMKAYSQMGRYKEIVKAFEQLKKVLKKELGVQPQEKTVDLYKSIIK
ncbi:MAG: bacterial transcriptional activator domain-containing protein, partial [candidate division WOR-3 bacterium]